MLFKILAIVTFLVKPAPLPPGVAADEFNRVVLAKANIFQTEEQCGSFMLSDANLRDMQAFRVYLSNQFGPEGIAWRVLNACAPLDSDGTPIVPKPAPRQ